MMEIHNFQTAEELLDFTSPWNRSNNLTGYVFRGHSQESFQLVPSALRLERADRFWAIFDNRPIGDQYNWRYWQVHAEYQILRSFYLLADQRGLFVPISDRMRSNLAQDFDAIGINGLYSSGSWIPNDLLETAALAQHYGLPTRLLDWTYDFYVALYFAARGALEQTGNLEVWAINKEELTSLSTTTERVNVEFITPHYAGNPNLSAQKGLFTHWPIKIPSLHDEIRKAFDSDPVLADRRPLEVQIAEQINIEQTTNIFKRLTLPCSEAKKMCKFLDKMGYDSARIFPGYQGVSEQILKQNTYK